MGAARRAARRALPLATLALLVWFARRVDWSATIAALRGASATLLALAVVAEVISVAAKGLRWWLFLRPLGANGPGLALRATFAGAGFNNLVVANGGEAARVLLVRRALRVSSARVLATLALDRAWEAVGYGALLVVTAAITPLPTTLSRARTAALAATAVLLAGLAWLARHPRRPPPGVAATAPVASPSERPTVGARLAGYHRRFGASLAELSTPRRSVAAFVLSLVVWATQVATYALGAAAAHAPLSLAGNLVTVLTVNLGFVVRVTPGGVGVFQALYAVAAGSFGVPGPTAIAAAILIQAVQIFPISAIGLAVAPELLRWRPADSTA